MPDASGEAFLPPTMLSIPLAKLALGSIPLFEVLAPPGRLWLRWVKHKAQLTRHLSEHSTAWQTVPIAPGPRGKHLEFLGRFPEKFSHCAHPLWQVAVIASAVLSLLPK
jgi:hypothetical protein